MLNEAADGAFTAWSGFPGQTTWIASTQKAPEGNSSEIVLSRDEGRTWEPLVPVEKILELARHKNPAWYHPGLTLRPAGLLGDRDTLIAAFTTPLNQGARSLGVYRFRLSAEGRVTATEDLTADLPWAYPVTSRILHHPGGAYVYFASRGAGLWRRRLP